MLEVPHRILLLFKKCFSSDMLQDFYNTNRSWCYTNYGRMRQNNYSDNNNRKSNNGGSSSMSNYVRSQSGSVNHHHRHQQQQQPRYKKYTNGGQFEFSLMTFNCLSQDLIATHYDMYSKCPRGSLDWPQRKERLARELRESNPDIVCLQEVNSVHHNQFYAPFFTSLGYSGIYKKRTGSMFDGCAFFYKTSKFTLLDKIELEFLRSDLTNLLNRDNIAIIGVLKPLIHSSSSSSSSPLENNRLVVATTHLIFNPSRGDVKLAQLRLLLAEMDKLINSFSEIERGKTNVLLCGDMNLIPYSPLYNFITTGFLDTSGYLCGDLSGQVEGTGHGKIFQPSDLKLEGINQSTQYISQSEDETDNNDDNKEKRTKNVNKGNQVNSNNSNHRRGNRNDNLSNDQETLRKTLLEKYSPKEKTINGLNGLNLNGFDSPLIKHNFKFSSVYPANDVNNSPFVTTHHGRGSCMVDYIFYNRSENLQLLGYTRLLNSEQMSQIGCLPNLFIGSDHLSLHAKFLIKG